MHLAHMNIQQREFLKLMTGLSHEYSLPKKVFWLGVVEELLWFISGSTSAKQLADVGSMWEGQNTSATCAMIWSNISQLLMMLRVGCEDGLMEANAREQAREREWKQRNIDINS
ncbi:bifunctional dihydrofolate reductase-thymidylate synthase 1, partial [Tanacetum coccineum]